jgi:hypothetical protein
MREKRRRNVKTFKELTILVLWIYSNYILQQEGRNLAKCQQRLSSTEVGLVLVAVLFAGNETCLGIKLKNVLNKIKIK